MESVINVLNVKFAGKLSLQSVRDYEKTVQEEQKILQTKIGTANGEIYKKSSFVIQKIENQNEAAENLTQELDDLLTACDKQEIEVQRIHNITQSYITKINLLKKCKCYLNTLKHIDHLSHNVETSLGDRGGRSVEEYVKLCSLVLTLNTTTCIHLTKYLSDVVTYWHSILKERFTKDYEELMKSLKWPFLAANVPPVPSTELLNRLQMLTETLIKIQLPDSLTECSSNPDISLPITLLVRPLKRRFVYHFSGSRQTNQADKPEWYFTQILTWLRDHQEFVEKHIQPVYNRIGKKNTSARLELARGLVQMAVEKLHWDLPHLQFDDALFSHTVDEALGFTTELRDGYGYPTTEPGVLAVLTQAHFFVKWINLEKKYSLEKLDAIMRCESAFRRCTTLEDGDYTPDCVTKFLTLLSTITERYSSLPQPGHRLQFLQLQLELLDDFRVRLLQMLRAQEEDGVSTSSMILNSVSCLIFVLEEWAVTPHFLQLQYYRQQTADVDGDHNSDQGVFADVITLLTTMQGDLLDSLTESLFVEAMAQSRQYRTDRWHAMEEPDEGVTPSSVRMFNILTVGLCNLNDALSPLLRTHAFKRVADALDHYLYEELVMQVFFSRGGARRFMLDVQRGLVPLFGQYLDKSHAYFPLLCDVGALLTLPQGSALLLKSALSDEEVAAGDVLTEVGVATLTTTQVIQVLARRTDL